MSWFSLTLILSLILLLSVSANLFLVWYAYRSIQQIRYYDDELTEVIRAIRTFTTHLKGIYEMEMFYGDETLRHFLRHGEEIIRVFDGYELFSDEEEEFNDNTTQEEATSHTA